MRKALNILKEVWQRGADEFDFADFALCDGEVVFAPFFKEETVIVLPKVL